MKKFSGSERRLIFSMGLLTGIRTLGASMIMPVFSYFAMSRDGASAQMAGIAVGIFGISQTLFQVPMGNLSDRWGKKRMTIIGSLIYAAGILMCGLSQNIYFLTAARFIAGAGAVSGVTMSWITAGVSEHRRNTAMGYLGLCIGLAVVAGFPLSWAITGIMDTSHVFYTCAVLVLAAVGYTVFFVSDRGSTVGHAGISPAAAWKVLCGMSTDRDMLRLMLSGFIGNFCLNGMFFILPLLIVRETHIGNMWKIFAPAALAGTAVMFFFARKADRQGSRRILLAGFAFELAGLAVPLASHSVIPLVFSLVLFYCGHCILSPVLPVAVSRYPGNELKGTVMSMFTSFQFLGTGIGGVAAGYVLRFSPQYLFLVLIILTMGAIVLTAGFVDFRVTRGNYTRNTRLSGNSDAQYNRREITISGAHRNALNQ